MLVTRGNMTWDVEEPVPTGPYFEGAFPGYGFWEEWQTGRWEPDTIATLDRFVKRGMTVIDLGACIGVISMYCAELGAKVIAVEPDPVAFSFLEQHCDRNVRGRVTCVQGAVADYDGECVLSAHPQGWASAMSSVTRTDLTDVSVTVPCFTVETLFSELDVTDCCLVKMDIEGMEIEVLGSVAPFLAERGVPLHLSSHELYWGGRTVDPEWFAGFRSIEGSMSGGNHAIAIP